MSDEQPLSEGAWLGRHLGELTHLYLTDPTIDPRATHIAREFRAALRQMYADFGAAWEQALAADPELQRLVDQVSRDTREEGKA